MNDSAKLFKLIQVAWGALVDSNLQVMPQILDLIYVWVLIGPLKDIYLFVPLELFSFF